MPEHVSKRPWKKTFADLGSRKWSQRAELLGQARADLELEVFAAYRDPSDSERDSELYKEHVDRIADCCAYGQFASVAEDEGGQDRAQHGLFGTSAAFAILSRASRLTNENSDQDTRTSWRIRFLRTLNFIDLFLTQGEQTAGTSTGMFSQRGMTLRLSLALRSLGVASGTITDVCAKPSPGEQAIIDQLSTKPAGVAPEHAENIVNILEGCLVLPATAISAQQDERTWKFSAEHDSTPTTVDEWVFMWSQVTVALARGWRGQLIGKTRVEGICGQAAFRVFQDLVLAPPSSLDRRFQLIGLWALSHFDFDTPGGPLAGHAGEGASLADGHLRLEKKTVKSLKQVTRDLIRFLLENEVRLADSWLPYSLKTSGDEWRDDFMVVPTVPVLLQLVARYDGFGLSDGAVLRLIEASLDEAKQRDIGRAKPYQIGNRDGVVNLLYYSDSYVSLEARCSAISSRFRHRWKATRNGFFRSFGRQVAVVTLIVMTALAFLGLLNNPESLALGLLFGLLGGFLATIAAPPIAGFLWDDRYPS